jgi:hypothetical protein
MQREVFMCKWWLMRRLFSYSWSPKHWPSSFLIYIYVCVCVCVQNGCLKILVKTCLKGDNLKIQR